MKWYNKDRKKGLNLDKVGYWEYYPEGNYLGNPAQLDIWIDGLRIQFVAGEAEEIYSLLVAEKELLKS